MEKQEDLKEYSYSYVALNGNIYKVQFSNKEDNHIFINFLNNFFDKDESSILEKQSPIFAMCMLMKTFKDQINKEIDYKITNESIT